MDENWMATFPSTPIWERWSRTPCVVDDRFELACRPTLNPLLLDELLFGSASAATKHRPRRD